MRRLIHGSFTLWLLAIPFNTLADWVDNDIKEEMRKHHVSGLSLAIIQDGRIVKAKGYGVITKGTKTPVTVETLFQAGSISKSVAALGALYLVEQGQLRLDEDVNAKLTSWKVPENEFATEKKVTLRGILSHTAGLTVHGFPGYAVGTARPSLVNILNGEEPANTRAIRVDIVPGSQRRYSGGGYTVMQQMMIDVTGKPFPEFMRETVLAPLRMRGSTFAQPLPDDKASATATGHHQDGDAVKGRWHIYPEMAAAGLWTTPSDLALFAIGIQQSLAGKSSSVITPDMTRQMLTDQQSGGGLGFFLEDTGKTLRFEHNGRDEGFDASFKAYADTGQGAVVMINANENSRMLDRIMESIAKEYHWPGYPTLPVYKTLPDKEPEVTKQIKEILVGFAQGHFDPSPFTPELASVLAKQTAQLSDEFRGRATPRSIKLVERKNKNENRIYRYRATYKNKSMLVRCEFNQAGKITGLSVQRE